MNEMLVWYYLLASLFDECVLADFLQALFSLRLTISIILTTYYCSPSSFVGYFLLPYTSTVPKGN